MLDSERSPGCIRLFVCCFVIGWTTTDSIAADRFRFETNDRAATFLSESEVATGLPEGFDLEKVGDAIGVKELGDSLVGWVSFGDARSRSVVMLLTADSPRRLFVDLDRDRKLTPAELIESSTDDPDVWLVDLKAEFVPSEGETFHQQQQLRVRYLPAGNRLAISASGSMTGVVDFANRQRLAKYVDRNANGRWFDAGDRLFVDFNGDGKLDPVLERVPCQGTRMIAGQLYAIAGDSTGRRLKINAVNDRGSLVPVISLADPTAKVISIDASVASDSGIQFPVAALDVPVEVPVGTWNVASLRITVQGESGTYSFDFATANPSANPMVIERDSTAELDLLGDLKITAGKTTLQQADSATRLVTPMLRSGSGLFLTNSRRGKEDATNENRLTAMSFSNDSEFFQLGSTGFT